MKELIEKDLITIDELDILKVSNPLNIDKELLQDYLVKATEFNPVELKRVLFFKQVMFSIHKKYFVFEHEVI